MNFSGLELSPKHQQRISFSLYLSTLWAILIDAFKNFEVFRTINLVVKWISSGSHYKFLVFQGTIQLLLRNTSTSL